MHAIERNNEKLILRLFAVLAISREDHFELYPFMQTFGAALSLLRAHPSLKTGLRYFRLNKPTGLYYELERIIARLTTLHYCHITSANQKKPKIIIHLPHEKAERLLEGCDDRELLMRAAGAWAKKYHEKIRRI